CARSSLYVNPYAMDYW
nr:immunoglobulin heavy chain junction region [Mus musculus]MBK4197226.1 immunoglobulin heavy chain junction region [Mus musculus]